MMNTAGIICPLSNENYTIKKYYSEMFDYFGWTSILIPVSSKFDLTKIDLLVLAGGGDIHSSFFGADIIPELRTIDYKRDKYEIELCCQAIDKQLSILGICRGMQLINVALGGTLIQHLPENQLIEHDSKTHFVNVIENHLKDIIGYESFEVNSFHHQALESISPDLTPFLYKGNVVEGIIGNKILGLQYHPELIYQKSKATQNILHHFLKTVKGC